MRILLAPDSFKGSLSAVEIAKILEQSAKKHFPDCETVLLPVADGGEGTVDALVMACGGSAEAFTVTGPAGAPVTARMGWIHGDTAVIEMAQASGLPLMNTPDPLAASSRGTGELISRALDAGAKRLLIGLGGSATNEGGMGMLAALGAAFYDDAGHALRGSGEDLTRVSRVDLSGLDKRALNADITVLCDVTNPLLGERGATRVYGPQKGVTEALYPLLEGGMARYAALLEHAVGRAIAPIPGAGAAGGMGAALAGVLGANLRPGIDTVLDMTGFDALLKACDLAVTGEGRLDGQSIRFGKAPEGVARRCRAQGVPVLAVTGGMGEGARAYYESGLASVMTTVNAVMPLDNALKNAASLLADAADRAFLLIKIGMHMRA